MALVPASSTEDTLQACLALVQKIAQNLRALCSVVDGLFLLQEQLVEAARLAISLEFQELESFAGRQLPNPTLCVFALFSHLSIALVFPLPSLLRLRAALITCTVDPSIASSPSRSPPLLELATALANATGASIPGGEISPSQCVLFAHSSLAQAVNVRYSLLGLLREFQQLDIGSATCRLRKAFYDGVALQLCMW